MTIGRNIDSFVEVSNAQEIGSNDVTYIVSKAGATPTDKKVTMAVLMSYFLGNGEVNDFNSDVTITVRANGKPSFVKMLNFEKHIFGSNEFTADKITADTIFRIASSNDVAGVRGYIKSTELVKALVGGDTPITTITDPSKANVRLTYDDKNSSIGMADFLKYLFGDSSETSVGVNDLIAIKGATKNYTIKYSDFAKIILPDTKRTAEQIAEDSCFVISDANTSNRGLVDMQTYNTYLKKALGIHTYDGDDNVTSNVSFEYRDGSKYGYLSASALKSIILNNETMNISEDAQLRITKTSGSGGTRSDGCITVADLKSSFMETVNAKYGATDSNTINESDGLVFIVKGSPAGTNEYKNISVVTLRETILNTNDQQAITPNTRIYVENGYITYSELRDQLHRDFFGN